MFRNVLVYIHNEIKKSMTLVEIYLLYIQEVVTHLYGKLLYKMGHYFLGL